MVAGGVSLFEALKQVENLRARGGLVSEEQGMPDAPGVAPPPSASVLGDLSAWNEMKR